jgi:FkbM family methyltransferase
MNYSELKYRIKSELKFLKLKQEKRITINERINKFYIRQFLPDNAIIVDAGAHHGYDSIDWAKILPKSKIYAFEPIPHVFEILKQYTQFYKQITCLPFALSDTNGMAEMYVSSGGSDGSSSLLKPKDHLVDHPELTFDEKCTVQTFTLDEWAKNNNLRKIDFMWLDMQGAELLMLKQSTQILPTIHAIHMEVSTKETYENVPQYAEVADWMKTNGFTVKIEAIPQGWDMENVLFVRETVVH